MLFHVRICAHQHHGIVGRAAAFPLVRTCCRDTVASTPFVVSVVRQRRLSSFDSSLPFHQERSGLAVLRVKYLPSITV